MTRQLFEDWLSSTPRGRRGPRHVSLPVSMALHGAAGAVLVTLPLLTSVELPDAGGAPRPPLVLRLPDPVPVVRAASRPLPVRKAAAAAARATSAPPLQPATQAAPAAAPGKLPDPEEFADLPPIGATLPLGRGCVGAGCVVGSDRPADRDGDGDDTATDDARRVRTVVSGRDVSPPVKLHDVRPVYPELARRAGLSGSVVIACTIAPDGRVAGARVESGPALLDQAALEAVRQWRYRPTLLGGAPVAVTMTVTVHFRLQRR